MRAAFSLFSFSTVQPTLFQYSESSNVSRYSSSVMFQNSPRPIFSHSSPNIWKSGFDSPSGSTHLSCQSR